METTMNATQIIKENRKPNTRYATNAKENVIAQWLNNKWTIIHIQASNCVNHLISR